MAQQHAQPEGPEEKVPARLRLYEYIRRNPAAHILELAEFLGYAHPTVMYHLRLLEEDGYVVSVLWGKRRVHFDADARLNAWEREVLALLALEEASAILARIATHPGTFPKELARDLGLSETTIKRYVPEFMRLQAIQEEQASFRRRLWISPTFRRRGRTLLSKLPPEARPVPRLLALVQEPA